MFFKYIIVNYMTVVCIGWLKFWKYSYTARYEQFEEKSNWVTL